MKSGRIIRRTSVTGFFLFSGSRNFLKDSRNRAMYLFNVSFAKMCSVLFHDRRTVFLYNPIFYPSSKKTSRIFAFWGLLSIQCYARLMSPLQRFLTLSQGILPPSKSLSHHNGKYFGLSMKCKVCEVGQQKGMIANGKIT